MRVNRPQGRSRFAHQATLGNALSVRDYPTREALAITLLAIPLPTKVITAQRMSSNTMDFSGIVGGDAFPSQNILLLSNRLQVSRVEAPGVSTQVVELHPLGNWTHQRFIGDSVHAPFHAPSHTAGDGHKPVPRADDAFVNPTLRRVSTRKLQTFGNRLTIARASSGHSRNLMQADAESKNPPAPPKDAP